MELNVEKAIYQANFELNLWVKSSFNSKINLIFNLTIYLSIN